VAGLGSITRGYGCTSEFILNLSLEYLYLYILKYAQVVNMLIY
jgi:hypothetical protein